MDRRDTFNHLFDAGFDYETYAARSDRHDERMKTNYRITGEFLSENSVTNVEYINKSMKVLCIAENWCGDCGHGVPIIARLAENYTNWDFRIIPRDEYDGEMSQYYLTAGRKKIPVIIFADKDGDEIGRWIERPKRSYLISANLKNEKLPKEKYIAKYKSMPELKPPSLTVETIRELLEIATKAGAMLDILPKKKE